MKNTSSLMALAFASLAFSGTVHPLDLGGVLKKTIENAATSEVNRKVDQETRRLTRCALGDVACEREQAALEAQDRARVQAATQGAVASSGYAAGSVNAEPGFTVVPYQGSVLEDERIDDFNEYERIIGAEKETERLEGRLIRRKYDNPKGRSTLELERNYRDALTAQGLSIDFSCAKKKECGNPAREPSWNSINGINLGIDGDFRYFTGSLSRNGGKVYVAVAINKNVHYVHTVETASMQSGLVSVDSLAAELDRAGRVELQGIFFDTGKATLRAESREALAQVAALMERQAGLRLAIVGHTDNVGSWDANLKLSLDRAEAVRSALAADYGIPASRLLARGMGSAQPVADNATPEGRARNRRVELLKE